YLPHPRDVPPERAGTRVNPYESPTAPDREPPPGAFAVLRGMRGFLRTHPAGAGSAEFLADQLDQAVADGVGLLGLRRLDHHPDQRLGAGGAQQDAAAALELPALPPPRLPGRDRAREGLAGG